MEKSNQLNTWFNPQQILGYSDLENGRTSFYNKITSSSLSERIKVTLAFDALTTKDKNRYKKQNNNYCLAKYEIYEAALAADLSFLKKNLKSFSDKTSINEHGRSILYTCCRSGYYNCVLFLLQIGSNISSLQENKSTPLHVASYYGHENVVKLLLSYGSSDEQVNQYEQTASEEARTPQIKEIIQNCENDIILHLFHQLKSKGQADCLERINSDQILRIYKKGPHGQALLSSYFKSPQYIRCYHGTSFKALEPIFKIGLKPSGFSSGDAVVSTKKGHISSNTTFAGIKNWGQAIFVTPSPFYAADIAYAQRIMSLSNNYCCIIEALVKVDSFTKHNHTLYQKQEIEGEPVDVEYRVAEKEDAIFLRVEKEQNVIVFSILFIQTKLLETQQSTYDEIIQLLNQFHLI